MKVESKIYDLIEQEMSAVSFVRDYVEFHFEEKILRAIASPSIRTNLDSATFPQSGSRDLFCKLIGEIVTDVVIREEEAIEIHFGGTGLIHIPLSQDTRIHGEAAHYLPDLSQPIEVW